MYRNIAIIGIHTGIGKTLVSAIASKALDAAYWKPVQAGSLDDSDSMQVHALSGAEILPERYRLQHPLSPHAAAALEGISIHINDFHLPQTSGRLVVETAGGLMSPLSETHTMLDLVKHLSLPVIIVSSFYLGSINHTMLTLEVLKQHRVPLLGMIFSGETQEASRSFILNNTDIPLLAEIPQAEVNAAFVAHEAARLKEILIHTLDGKDQRTR